MCCGRSGTTTFIAAVLTLDTTSWILTSLVIQTILTILVEWLFALFIGTFDWSEVATVGCCAALREGWERYWEIGEQHVHFGFGRRGGRVPSTALYSYRRHFTESPCKRTVEVTYVRIIQAVLKRYFNSTQSLVSLKLVISRKSLKAPRGLVVL